MVIYVVTGAAYNSPPRDDVFWVAKATTDRRAAESFAAAASQELYCLDVLLARRELTPETLEKRVDSRMPQEALQAYAGYEYQLHEIPLEHWLLLRREEWRKLALENFQPVISLSILTRVAESCRKLLHSAYRKDG